MKTNQESLVMQAVQGSISHPQSGKSPYRMDREGRGNILPGTGGISYNVRVGDPAFSWTGDHIEPGVSMKIPDKARSSDMYGLSLLACIGNQARVVSGNAEGAEGVVTGTHGGIFHVLIDFEKEDLESMKIGDEILIKAYGQGLRLENYPEILIFNLDPRLLTKMRIEQQKDSIAVPVTASIPARLMGSGIGSPSVALGDYDMTTGDLQELKELGLDDLRLGDFVYLEDCDNSYGREYRKGAASIGIVVHSDCIKMGHGPGVTTLMTSQNGQIEPILDKTANLVNYI